jgi:hypothetical protein
MWSHSSIQARRLGNLPASCEAKYPRWFCGSHSYTSQTIGTSLANDSLSDGVTCTTRRKMKDHAQPNIDPICEVQAKCGRKSYSYSHKESLNIQNNKNANDTEVSENTCDENTRKSELGFRKYGVARHRRSAKWTRSPGTW